MTNGLNFIIEGIDSVTSNFIFKSTQLGPFDLGFDFAEIFISKFEFFTPRSII